MNLQEFAALKIGDRVRNDMSHSNGEVVDVDNSGVRVRWEAAGKKSEGGPASVPTWHYSVQSTAWFHWSRLAEVSAELDVAISDELAHPPASIMKDEPNVS